MISRWSTDGDLPPGVHFATWEELEDRLAFNPRRHRMLAGFRRACEELRKAGCRLVYLDGSFVTRKQRFLGELFPARLPEGATGRALWISSRWTG